MNANAKEISDWKAQLRKHSTTIEKVAYMRGGAFSRLSGAQEGGSGGYMDIKAVKNRLLLNDGFKINTNARSKDRLSSEDSEVFGTLNVNPAASNGYIKIQRKSSKGNGSDSSRERDRYLKPTTSAVLKQSNLAKALIEKRSSVHNSESSVGEPGVENRSGSMAQLKPKQRDNSNDALKEGDKENNRLFSNRPSRIRLQKEDKPVTGSDYIKPPISKNTTTSRTRMLTARSTKSVADSNNSLNNSSVELSVDFNESKLANTLMQQEGESKVYVEFGAQTDQGLVRKYNEDRVCVIQRICRDSRKIDGKYCSMFSLFDGHGGDKCAEYLKDELYTLIARNPHFPTDKKRALLEGFIQAEGRFITQAKLSNDQSGSCAIVVLLDGIKMFVANAGDSRAFLVHEDGSIDQMSKDHKPESLGERDRVIKSGGRVYRLRTYNQIEFLDIMGLSQLGHKEANFGPFRIEPGGLSVARSLGDIKSKDPAFGGNPECVCSLPEITEWTVKKSNEFLVIACDGIFDVISNEDAAMIARKSLIQSKEKGLMEKDACTRACSMIIEEAKVRRSNDNLTVILVLFKPLSHFK